MPFASERITGELVSVTQTFVRLRRVSLTDKLGDDFGKTSVLVTKTTGESNESVFSHDLHLSDLLIDTSSNLLLYFSK